MAKRKSALSVLLGLALLGFVACGTAVQTSVQNVQNTETPLPQEVSLTDANNGQTVEMRTGQVLVIRLKGNLTTGYRWGVTDALPFLEAQGDLEYNPDSNLIGAPGTFILRFDVTGSGNGTLSLAYRRPFETDVAPIQTYSVQVVAR
jgi:inhibitor of cysteine peptidase